MWYTGDIMGWQTQLTVDPVPVLLSFNNEAITYFVKKDLLHERVHPDALWELPGAQILLKKQKKGWVYPKKAKEKYPSINYDLLETFRNTGILVEQYGFTNDHPAIQKAADYLFSCQTKEGDFRGMYGTEYAPNYTGAILEVLLKAGYNNQRIEKGFTWLLSMRQNDGGWASPLRTHNVTNTAQWAKKHQNPVLPDRTKPFSHLFTGMVLRAFAAHPVHKTSKEAKKAGELLLSRFFKADKYVDRRNKQYWEKLSFPFWFTDIVSTLDSVSVMGFTRNDTIDNALTWLINRQRNGLFNITVLKSKKDSLLWISLAICRILKRFYS